MYPCFDVDGISSERLSPEWKWLAPGELALLAVNPCGDLFLRNIHGAVQRLDITAGSISKVANSEREFRDAATEPSKKNEWFLIEDAEAAKRKGYCPTKGQCLGSKIPWFFHESAGVADNLCVIDLYQHVSFIGDVHNQLRGVPDSGKVRIKIVT